MSESPTQRRVAAAAAAALLLGVGLVAVAILSVGPAARSPRPTRVPRPAPVAAAPAPAPEPGHRARRPREVSVDEPAVEPEPEPDVEAPARVYGQIAGGGDIRIRACGTLTRASPDGSWSAEVEPGPCEVVAIRQDGQFPMLSEPVDLTLRPGDDRDVELKLPRHKAAGLGIAIRPSQDGIRVADAIEGGAAVEAGISRGDLILEIDGEPTPGMDLEEFQRWGIGKAGTSVALVVQHRDGSEETVRLDRRSLD